MEKNTFDPRAFQETVVIDSIERKSQSLLPKIIDNINEVFLDE